MPIQKNDIIEGKNVKIIPLFYILLPLPVNVSSYKITLTVSPAVSLAFN